MRLIIPVFFLLLISVNINAQEPVDDQQIMLYYQIPLGSDNPISSRHQFGLRLDRTTHDPYETVSLGVLDKQTAAMDFRMGYAGVESFTIHGVDYAAALIAKANAEESVPEVSAETTTTGEAENAATESTAKAEEQKPAEKGEFQKKMDELPFGVIMGVLIGVGIFAGVGG